MVGMSVFLATGQEVQLLQEAHAESLGQSQWRSVGESPVSQQLPCPFFETVARMASATMATTMASMIQLARFIA